MSNCYLLHISYYLVVDYSPMSIDFMMLRSIVGKCWLSASLAFGIQSDYSNIIIKTLCKLIDLFAWMSMASTKYDCGRVFEPCVFFGCLVEMQMKSELIEADTYNQQDTLWKHWSEKTGTLLCCNHSFWFLFWVNGGQKSYATSWQGRHSCQLQRCH